MHCVQVPLDGTDTGSLASSRSAAIRLTRLTPQTLLAYCPHPSIALWEYSAGDKGHRCGLCRRARQPAPEPGATRSLPRVRWVQPPDNGVPQLGHCSTTCSTLWVGRHAGSGKALATRPAGFLWLGRFPVLFWASDRASVASPCSWPALPVGQSVFSKSAMVGLLLGDNVDQDVPASGLEINFPFHPTYMT